jgi:hypothetical protein
MKLTMFKPKNKGLLIKVIGVFLVLVIASMILFSSMKSNTTAQMVINYSDGTSHTYSSNDTPLFGGAILDPNRNNAVAVSISTNLNIIPDFSGDVASYTVNAGTFSVQILNTNNAIMYSNNAVLNPTSHPTLVSGQSMIICSSTASTSGIPFSSVAFTSGQTYTLVNKISGFSISGVFTDGQPFGPIVAKDAQISWTFKYQSSNSFNSLSLVFSISSA